MSEVKFEVCLQSPDDIVAAMAGGAHRVELCSALVEGGLTPSLATIEAASEMDIDVMVMIRPRGGDFDYTQRELQVMENDILHLRELNIMGVVFGVLTPEGEVAGPQVRRLMRAAGPLQTTFHRAFDVCRDPFRALAELRALGFDRVLTSGQAATAPAGVATIRRLIEEAEDALTILPGGGLTAENVGAFVRATNAREVHATAFARQQSRMKYRNPSVYMGVPGLPEYVRETTAPDAVRQFINGLRYPPKDTINTG